jgi:hypothetical protein
LGFPKFLVIVLAATALVGVGHVSFWTSAERLIVVNEHGKSLTSVFAGAPFSIHAVALSLSPSQSKASTCSGRESLAARALNSIRMYALTPFTVKALECGLTNCGGSRMIPDPLECCPGGGGLYSHYYSDPSGSDHSGVRFNATKACGNSPCPEQCREVGCTW